MTVYVLGQIAIHDRDRYERYRAAFMPILTRYGGRLLAADEAPERLNGDWPLDKIVLIEFADRETALRWMTSPDYQEISRDRIAATTGTGLLVRGLAMPQPSESATSR